MQKLGKYFYSNMIIISITDIKLINIDMKNTNNIKDKWTKVIYEHIFKNKNTASVLNEEIFNLIKNGRNEN